MSDMKELIERLRSGLRSTALDENEVLHAWIEIAPIMDAIDALEAAQRTIESAQEERIALWDVYRLVTLYTDPSNNRKFELFIPLMNAIMAVRKLGIGQPAVEGK